MKFNVRDLLFLTTLMAGYVWLWQRVEIPSYFHYGRLVGTVVFTVIPMVFFCWMSWVLPRRLSKRGGELLLTLQGKKYPRTIVFVHFSILSFFAVAIIVLPYFPDPGVEDDYSWPLFLLIAEAMVMHVVIIALKENRISIRQNGVVVGPYLHKWFFYDFSLNEVDGQTCLVVKSKATARQRKLLLDPETPPEEFERLRCILDEKQPSDSNA